MGNNKQKILPVTDYTFPEGTDVKLDKTHTKDTLTLGILKYSSVFLDIGGSLPRWMQAVKEVAAWYVQNVKAYSQVETIFCPLVGKSVRMDCSGFTTACLQRYGLFKNTTWAPSSESYTSDPVTAKELENGGFKKYAFSWETVKPFDIITFPGHVEIYNGVIDGKHTSWAWGAVHKSLPCGTSKQKNGYDYIWRCEGAGNGSGIISKIYNMGKQAITGMANFIGFNGPADGSIGSKEFPQGKGKSIDPSGNYWPFYTFGFGASPKAQPSKAHSLRSGVDCCKLAINTVLSYMQKGCKTIGDVICMYHAGMPSYESFIKYYSSRLGVKDVADGRFVSSQEMISRQNYYQKHLVDYTHMSNNTPLECSYRVLFPLITFISRQEQGVNSEEACRIALKEMNIT